MNGNKNVLLDKDGIKLVDYPEEEILEIEGVPYTYALFQAFSGNGLALDRPFVICKRDENDVITMQLLGSGIIKGGKFYPAEIEVTDCVNGKVFNVTYYDKEKDETSKKK